MKSYIVARTLVDGKRDTPLTDQIITVENGRIAAITPLASSDPGQLPEDRTYTVEYALPGLLDCHNHLACDVGDQEDRMRQHIAYTALRVARNARMELLSGVTTMRTCGEKDGIDFAYRRAINEWIVPGPRILPSGAQIAIRQAIAGPTKASRSTVRRPCKRWYCRRSSNSPT